MTVKSKNDGCLAKDDYARKVVHSKIEYVIPTLNQHLNVQAVLCDALEGFADRLPYGVTADECLALAQMVYPTVQRAHQFEETVLFPILAQRPENQEQMQKTLDRLHGEHWEDESFAGELAQALRDFVATDDANKNVGMLAYMIRGFFDGLRRHLAFEREHILPILSMHEVAARPSTH